MAKCGGENPEEIKTRIKKRHLEWKKLEKKSRNKGNKKHMSIS